MTAWTKQPPSEPGFYWAKASFLGPPAGAPEPVRVEMNPHFGVTWEEFAAAEAARPPDKRLPPEWVFQVYAFGTELPYAIGDIDGWGPAIEPE